MKKKLRLIKSIKELKEALAEGKHGFAIALNGGVKSCKAIWLHKDGKKFRILNSIDDTKQTLSEKQIMDEGWTNIGKAMKKNCLFVDDDFYVDEE